VVDEPSKDHTTAVSKVFSCYKKLDYNEFEYGKPLVIKQAHENLMWPMRRLHEWYYLACVCGLQFIEARIPEAVFKT
jgi:hypothetical protein